MAAAAVAGALMLAVVVVLSSIGPTAPAYVDLQEPKVPTDGREGTGRPLLLSSLAGEVPTGVVGFATPELRVIVVKVPAAALHEAARATGQPVGKWAIDHPHEPGMRLVAYDAASTHLGCTVRLVGEYGIGERHGIPAILLMDVCHQGQWNALAMGANLPGTAAPRPLSVVPLALGPGPDPVIQAGPPLDQERPFDAANVRLAFRSG